MAFGARAVGAVAAILILLAGFGSGWKVRGWEAAAGAAKVKEVQTQAVAVEQAKTDETVRQDTLNTQVSTEQVDKQEQQRQIEVRYVDREVIKYRDRHVVAQCVLPTDWVLLYNASGEGTTDELPAAGAAGPAPDGAPGAVSAPAPQAHQ